MLAFPQDEFPKIVASRWAQTQILLPINNCVLARPIEVPLVRLGRNRTFDGRFRVPRKSRSPQRRSLWGS